MLTTMKNEKEWGDDFLTIILRPSLCRVVPPSGWFCHLVAADQRKVAEGSGKNLAASRIAAQKGGNNWPQRRQEHCPWFLIAISVVCDNIVISGSVINNLGLCAIWWHRMRHYNVHFAIMNCYNLSLEWVHFISWYRQPWSQYMCYDGKSFLSEKNAIITICPKAAARLEKRP